MKTITRLEPGHTAMIEYALKVADAIGIRYGMVHGEYMNEKTRESKHAFPGLLLPQILQKRHFCLTPKKVIAPVLHIPGALPFSCEEEISQQILLIRNEAAVIDHCLDLFAARPFCISNFLGLKVQVLI